MNKKKEKVGNSIIPERIVYFSDFRDLLMKKVKEMIEDSRGWQFCCHCAGTKNESICDCVDRKKRRDGTDENIMSAGLVSLDEACVNILAMTREIIEILKEKSFICECSLLKLKVEEEKETN